MPHGFWVKALATAVLVAATVAACGGDSPQPTPTATPEPTATATETATAPSPTPSPTPTATATRPPTQTPTATPDPTPSPAPTSTATPAPTVTPTPVPTPPEPVEPITVTFRIPRSPVFHGPEGVVADITVGASHACALTEAAEAVCWDIESGEVWDTPPGPYTLIEAEGDETCAITGDCAIVCWTMGGHPFPEDRDPSRDAPPGRYQSFSWTRDDRGYTHTCAVTDGSKAVCWTSPERESPSPDKLAIPDLPPGKYTAIDVRHAFFGWSEVSLTVCALTDTGGAVCSRAGRAHASVFEPFTRVLEGQYTSVAVSGSSSCALSVTGEIEGCAVYGGSGTTRYVVLSPGEKHVCAVTDAGQIECWVHGSGWFAQGELLVMDPPATSSGGYVDVSVGHRYGCALDEAGGAICWGDHGNKVAPPHPAPGRYVSVSDGYGHTCALTEDGEAVCWGWNNTGQATVPAGRYKAISAGITGTCALTVADEMVCWGWDTYRHQFTASAYRFITLAPDQPLTCAVSDAGVAVCHGPTNFMEPVEFPGGPYRSVHVGRSDRICALSEDGNLVCRSTEHDAALSPPVDRPVVVGHGTGPLCFVNDAGEVVCWGPTTLAPPSLPVGRYVAISVGLEHGCALTEGGEVRCWGSLPDGVLPGAPPGRYVAISSSSMRVCAVTEEGDVVCWGDTDYVDAPSGDPYW